MDTQELLEFFKALADANRLKIVGLLAQNTHTVEQLAVTLDLRPSTISHHLSRLSKAGLVSARAEGYYNHYRLETKRIETVAQKLLAHESLHTVVEGIDQGAYSRKALADFTSKEGNLKSSPSKHKKLLIILRHIVESFKPNEEYSEKEVNQILARFHADTTTLRRELVAARLLEREKGVYWRSLTG